MTQYETRYSNGNGYLLVVYHPVDGANSNDGGYVAEVTGMPQTQAASPFKAPIDESMINLQWPHISKMETDEIPAMQFPDGEKFDLIYPEISILSQTTMKYVWNQPSVSMVQACLMPSTRMI